MGQFVIAAAVAGLALAGCSLGELNFGSSGGVVSEQMTTDIFGIKSSPNASNEDVLLKAAQTTKSAGATHFKVISAADVGRPLDVMKQGDERTAGSPYSPSTGSTVIKPGQDAYIRVLRLAPGQQPPGGFFDADELIQLMGRRARGG